MKGGERLYGNPGNMGERTDEVQRQKEAGEKEAQVMSRAAWNNYERLILGLGISALVCLIVMVALRLVGTVSMLLFMLVGVQLVFIGGLIALRAAVVIVRFQCKRSRAV